MLVLAARRTILHSEFLNRIGFSAKPLLGLSRVSAYWQKLIQ